MNPIVFNEYIQSEEFQACCNELSEFRWYHQIVGFNGDGVLYVDEKIPQSGFYLFYPRLCEWSNVKQLSVITSISWLGVAAGLFMWFLAYCAIRAGFVEQTYHWARVILIPLIFIPGGALFVFGCRRNQVRLQTFNGVHLSWMSGPMLGRTETVSFCYNLTKIARRVGVTVISKFESPES
jgi:hypothetical protein